MLVDYRLLGRYECFRSGERFLIEFGFACMVELDGSLTGHRALEQWNTNLNLKGTVKIYLCVA